MTTITIILFIISFALLNFSLISIFYHNKFTNDTTYFILSKENLCIERFHICTWNLKDSSVLVEFGIEIFKKQLCLEFEVFLEIF